MSDDEKRKQVLDTQLQIAYNMKLSQNVVEFLGSIAEWDVREWYFICALDRMPLAQLQEMQSAKYTIPKIKKARQDFLQKSFADMDVVNREIERLRKEANEVFAESKNIREAISNNLEGALQKQAQAQEETIKTKDSMIAMLQKQIDKLEAGQTAGREAAVIYKKRPEIEPEPEFKIQEKEKKTPLQKNEERVDHVLQKKLSDWKRQNEIKHFIDKYIKEQELSDEQKEFLLNCLDEGMNPSDAAELAAPGLSLGVMQRLKELKKER